MSFDIRKKKFPVAEVGVKSLCPPKLSLMKLFTLIEISRKSVSRARKKCCSLSLSLSEKREKVGPYNFVVKYKARGAKWARGLYCSTYHNSPTKPWDRRGIFLEKKTLLVAGAKLVEGMKRWGIALKCLRYESLFVKSLQDFLINFVCRYYFWNLFLTTCFSGLAKYWFWSNLEKLLD